MYAGHNDSALYSYYSTILNESYEKTLLKHDLTKCITGFRKIDKKCNIHFAQESFIKIQYLGECWALAFDIKSFFDKIDHAILKRKWAEVLCTDKLPKDHYAIYKSLTKFSFVDKNILEERLAKKETKHLPKRICSINDFHNIVRKEKLIIKNESPYGIPQGSPISGLLSNISMLDFDIRINSEALATEAYYYRYCDDILIICKPSHKDTFENLVTRELENIQLATNEKTKRHRFTQHDGMLSTDKPLQYLGLMFDGVRTYIRSSSISRYISKIKKRVYMAVKSRDKTNAIRVANGEAARPLFKKTLYGRNTHFGLRNFIKYGLRASQLTNSKTTRRQVLRAEKRFYALIKHH